MLLGTVKGGAILTAFVLVAVCLSCMAPAFTGEPASETGTSESVVIEIDTEDKTLAEIIVDYATASAEKEYHESMGRDVFIVVQDRPDMPGSAGYVMDWMNQILDVRSPAQEPALRSIGMQTAASVGALTASDPDSADGPGSPANEGPNATASEEQPDEEEAVEDTGTEESDTGYEIVQAGSDGIEPDEQFIEDVLEYLESLGDESLDETVEALRAYLEARFVLELNDSLVRTLDDQKDEESDGSDGPVLVDEEEEEPSEPPFEPVPEPESPSAPSEPPAYRTGVSTSGLL